MKSKEIFIYKYRLVNVNTVECYYSNGQKACQKMSKELRDYVVLNDIKIGQVFKYENNG